MAEGEARSGRRPFIAGNWKMNTTAREAEALAEDIARNLRERPAPDVEVMVAPPFPYLGLVARRLEGTGVALGGQDAGWAESGAFTGAVSPSMLKDVGCTFVILGHSERRTHLSETDEIVSRKVKAALSVGLTPILCVGESATARKQGQAVEVVTRQLAGSLKGVEAPALARLVVAYEPVWAIGTGDTATPEQAQEMHALIRERLAETGSPAAAKEVRIQYGGSVTPESIGGVMAQPDVDGALVGGASLSAKSFLSIIYGGR